MALALLQSVMLFGPGSFPTSTISDRRTPENSILSESNAWQREPGESTSHHIRYKSFDDEEIRLVTNPVKYFVSSRKRYRRQEISNETRYIHDYSDLIRHMYAQITTL